jgi:PAS domain S-box-containing protein
MSRNFPVFPNYRITEQIYDGSRTIVYRGISESEQKSVVIKLLKSEYPTFSELVQFRNQYTITKNLDLAGIVKPIVLEKYGNSFALFMEDMGGISLSEYLGDRSMSLDEFLPYGIAIAQILAELYHNRVIHKDIKPQNIIINPETKEIQLIDFSIASLLPRETQEIANPNVLEGTLAYISPEQTGRMNRGIDYRTDFYSLGVTFYQLLTGRLPFELTDPMEVVHCHIARQPIPLIEIVPTIPQVVSDIVMKLMAKTAELRYQSAFGLRYDLEKCWHQWQEKGSITEFSLGERDVCDRFVIPEKLYGREAEVKTLLEAFERVSDPPLPPLTKGGKEIMLVAGFSGIGKTAVVNEVHKPIVRQRGYFIKGKFDQFKRDIPFSAWVQALENLIRQLLSESAAELQKWQVKILEALGENGQVIIDVIPELEQLIGKQPNVPALEGISAQNRFNLLFQKFIQVFATKEHPLVIFLDDLQWADSASLKLMQLLMSETNTRHLLLMGAYRDNEVFPAHPLMLTLDEIRKDSATVNQITLAPLDQPSLNRLIADTLSCPAERAIPLTELVFAKTKGNPFFATQFLKSLYEDGLIAFDFNASYWQCDIAQVKALALTDDVVEFMAVQLQKLPVNTQEVLKLAACIGNQFDLATLAIVHEKSQSETAADLWKALQEGLVIPISEVYKFFQDSESVEVAQASDLSVPYKFLHDRVQQAAYFLIPENKKQSTHLEIGRLLLRNTLEAEREEKIFDIVNQLNIGVELITAQIERDELAELNLIAGRKAKYSTAYGAAKKYLTVGLELLDIECWQNHYNLTLGLYEEATEAMYLNGEFEQMEQLAETVLQNANALLDKIKVYQVKIQALKAQNQLKQSLNFGLDILALLGIDLPKDPEPTEIPLTFEQTQLALQGKRIQDLIDLPDMTDPQKLAATQILLKLCPSAYMVTPVLLPLITFKQIQLALEYGNASTHTHAYANYGLILCGVMRELESGAEFGELALNLLEKLDAKPFKAMTLFVESCFIKHWKKHVKETLKPFLDSYFSGLETGDLEHAGYSAQRYCYHLYFSGSTELSRVELEMQTYRDAINKINQDSILQLHQIYHQLVLNLLGMTENPCRLIGSACDEAKMLPLHIANNYRIACYYFYLNKLILCYLFGEYKQAVEHSVGAEQYLDAGVASILVPIFYTYDSLSKLAVYADVAISEPQKILEDIANNQQKMQNWGESAPMNYLHKFYLVEAERHRVLGEKVEAIAMYDLAIKGAKENEYANEEALANELAAKFYLEWGKEKIAQVYLTDAYYAYARWGAKAKVEDLEKRYPQLLAPILNQKTALKTGETIAQMMTGTITSSSSGVSEILDLETVIKAAQSLSGEIHLERLLSTLMQVIIENAGAEKSSLILLEKDSFFVAAQSVSGKGCNLHSTPVADSEQIPITLINYVWRTQKTLVINDATAENTFAGDSYIIRHQPKSVLCMPIQNQGVAIALLYLENNLIAGAFTPARLEVLKVLASQAAISIKNAQLYANLETIVEERTQELQESQAKFSGILQIAGDAIISVNESQQICLFNQAAEQMFGYTAQEVIGQHLDILLPTTVRDRHRHHIGQFGSEEAPFRSMGKTERGKIQGQRKNGELFPAEASISRLQLRDGLLFTVIMNDITERKQAEEAIKQKNQELASTLQQLQTTQEELIQSEKMAALGQLVAGVAHEINTPLGAIRSSIGYISEFLEENLSKFPVLFRELTPEREEQFLALLARSLTNTTTISGRERRQLRKALTSELEAQNINNADTLANFLLDLGIRDNLEPLIPLLQQPDSDSFLKIVRSFARLQESTRDINTASDRAAKVVFALKTYARYDQTGETVQANILDGLEAVLTLYHNQIKHGVELIRHYQELPPIECYFDELNQVWTNLIHNALQAMDNKGTLTIAAIQQEGDIKISITDSGKGIPDEIKDKIFQPFFTTKPAGEGSGLGLDIVRKIVAKHQGTITFASVPGQTTFTVSLPML